MASCTICSTETEVHFNINFALVAVCENCASAIFLQQAKSYAEDKSIYETQLTPKRKSPKKYPQETCEVINYLNELLQKKKRYTVEDIPNSIVDFISARIDEGYTVDKIKAVTYFKVKEWKDDRKMKHYLRPSTLYNKTKFTNYAFQLPENLNPDNSKEQREMIRTLNKFGMRGIVNQETDALAKKLMMTGYDNKEFLNNYLLITI